MRIAVVIGAKSRELRAKRNEENKAKSRELRAKRNEENKAKGRELGAKKSERNRGEGQRARGEASLLFALRSVLFALRKLFGEGDNHSRKGVKVVQNWGDVSFDELSSFKDKQHACTFKERFSGDIKKLAKVRCGVATRSFRDIVRDRQCCCSELFCESILALSVKIFRQFVKYDRNIGGTLPNLQVLKSKQRLSLPALRPSPFAHTVSINVCSVRLKMMTPTMRVTIVKTVV